MKPTMTTEKELCANCGHEKRYHSNSMREDGTRGDRMFCSFVDKTENWDIDEESKKQYLECGLTELGICPCTQFVPQKDNSIHSLQGFGESPNSERANLESSPVNKSPEDKILPENILSGRGESPETSGGLNSKIIMSKQNIVKDTLMSRFKKMYSSEIFPILKQKKQLYAKISELNAKISEFYAKESELNAKRNELNTKRSELYAKINELDAKIFWKFVKFEKENDCKIEWKDYDFNLEDITIKSNAEIEEKAEVPQEITQNGHTYKLIS